MRGLTQCLFRVHNQNLYKNFNHGLRHNEPSEKSRTSSTNSALMFDCISHFLEEETLKL